MFYPRTIGRRKNWGITSRVSPGANPFILTLLVLLMLILLSPEVVPKFRTGS